MAALTPQQAFDLALQHHRAGQLAVAETLYRQLLALDPQHADALHLLGLVVGDTGSTESSTEWVRKAIAVNPAVAIFHNSLGNLLQDQGRYAEAVDAYRRAIHLDPAFALAYNNLGNAWRAQGHRDEAFAAFHEALRLDPDLVEAHSNLANTLGEAERLDEAIASFRRAITLKPTFAMAHNNLGNALLAQGRDDEAIAAFREALALQPNLALAHTNLGNAWKKRGQVEEAIASYHRALDCDPHFALALGNLATTLHDRGETDEAIPLYRQSVELPQSAAVTHSGYLAVIHYWPPATPPAILEAHRGYEQRHAQPFRASWQPHANSREPDRALRLGFISPFFRNHPVGSFLVGPLESLDRRQFQVVLYSDGRRADAMTARLQACAAEWHELRGVSDEQLARRIREDRIDILFDLAGHTAGNRLLVFARKPAPIQITWLDYVGTTGLSAIDYILADPRQIPPGAEPYYSEKVLRMPDDYICFDPPAVAPAVGPLPAATNGYVTFASFNILQKTTAQIIHVWSRILHAVPGARLILKNRDFETPAAAARFRQRFAEQAIDPNRILFQGWSPHAELLASYHHVDIGLDTFPYNGGLTTCEALWMGVPVVTCPGETFASRHGLAHLTAAGFTETIARDLDDYVKIAVSLANDLPRLSTLRAELRARVASSPLCDGPRFATHLTTLLRGVWRTWCADASL